MGDIILEGLRGKEEKLGYGRGRRETNDGPGSKSGRTCIAKREILLIEGPWIESRRTQTGGGDIAMGVLKVQ